MKSARRRKHPAVIWRGLMVLLVISLLGADSNPRAASSNGGDVEETRFWTGCDPGPHPAPPYPEHQQSKSPVPTAARSDRFIVDLDSAGSHRPILGSGFNFEHALWSCAQFRGLFQSDILDAFQPGLARVD